MVFINIAPDILRDPGKSRLFLPQQLHIQCQWWLKNWLNLYLLRFSIWINLLTIYNPGHNILQIFNVLVRVLLFTSSKIKTDIYNNVTSCVTSCKLNFDNIIQKVNNSRHESFQVLPSFLRFLYFIPNILSVVVWANTFCSVLGPVSSKLCSMR